MKPLLRVFLAVSVLGFEAISQPVRFAMIGDYGYAGPPEDSVAALVHTWNPDFIVTLGDNNYDNGAASTIDQNIGQYYHQFIFPYTGSYGQGDTVNRFFPSLGNHDWVTTGAIPYLNYFSLPGNERYYDFVNGGVHFFVIDSDTHEPDGTVSTSVQGQWLQNKLDSSIAQWKIVYFHHSPYSSSSVHGSTAYMRWPFDEWGASIVLTGHDHTYERLEVNGFPYIVNGLGGRNIYAFGTPLPGSLIRFNLGYGAQLADASPDSIVFSFYAATGGLVDRFVLRSQEQATHQYLLHTGWNLVSLPLVVSDPRVTTIFPLASSEAYSFSGSEYVKGDSLSHGIGYWLKFDTAQTPSITGIERAQDTIAIQAGWNIVGISISADTGAIGQIPPGLIESPYYTFTSDYEVVGTLESGNAYWVKASSAGQLVFPGLFSGSHRKKDQPVRH